MDMNSKPLLYGLIGFFLGGLIVSVAATTFDKPSADTVASQSTSSSMTMDDMTAMLRDKSGDEFDEAFISGMIEHHDGAVEMAKLAAANAKHDEIKQLSKEIISAQEREIGQMVQWRQDWGYKTVDTMDHSSH